ncbi:MAG TPA: TIGR01777 family oxidoreductase [Acidimicrobiales bacterium]|nr:TIGR01777 family oxidoreductase [Acidimicrobiales bacterium]
MNVLVSGAGGLIGSALVPSLESDGHTVRRLVRGRAEGHDVSWDPSGGTIDVDALQGSDAVVHLAGESIAAHRWSDEQKARIRDSRIRGTSLLADSLAKLPTPPQVLVSSSAIGYYGDRGEEELTEDSGPGDDFLADVCVQWEAATEPAEQVGVRVVHIRTGIVLAPGGGSLKRQVRIFKLGLGGRIGSGRQYVSWISLDDEIGAIRHLLGTATARGPHNLVSPGAVTNAELTKTLARVLSRPALLPVPAFALDVVLGEGLARSLALASQRVVPARLLETEYEFGHPDLEGALRHVLA